MRPDVRRTAGLTVTQLPPDQQPKDLKEPECLSHISLIPTLESKERICEYVITCHSGILSIGMDCGPLQDLFEYEASFLPFSFLEVFCFRNEDTSVHVRTERSQADDRIRSC